MRLTGDGWAVARALVLAVGLCYDHWRRLHQMYDAVIENGIGIGGWVWYWYWWLGLVLVVGLGIGGWVWYWIARQNHNWLRCMVASVPTKFNPCIDSLPRTCLRFVLFGLMVWLYRKVQKDSGCTTTSSYNNVATHVKEQYVRTRT